jgi:hypothetical protein
VSAFTSSPNLWSFSAANLQARAGAVNNPLPLLCLK